MNIVWPHLSIRTPAPGVMTFTILKDPSFLLITIYIVCLHFSVPCPSVDKSIFTIHVCPSTRTPAQGVIKVKSFGRLFLCHHYFILSLSDLRLGVEK